MKYYPCPKCSKKGYYTKVAKNPSDCISMGHRGCRDYCKYCGYEEPIKESEFDKLLNKIRIIKSNLVGTSNNVEITKHIMENFISKAQHEKELEKLKAKLLHPMITSELYEKSLKENLKLLKELKNIKIRVKYAFKKLKELK